MSVQVKEKQTLVMGTMHCVEQVAAVLESTSNKVALQKMVQKYEKRAAEDLFKTPLALERRGQTAVLNDERAYSVTERCPIVLLKC
jgi:hypothetical protein